MADNIAEFGERAVARLGRLYEAFPQAIQLFAGDPTVPNTIDERTKATILFLVREGFVSGNVQRGTSGNIALTEAVLTLEGLRLIVRTREAKSPEQAINTLLDNLLNPPPVQP